ncbi:MAG TPA: class IV adenylate cyclase [Acidobacteriaceae bacterium]
MSPVEVEVKFRVADRALLAEQLQAAGLSVVTPSTFERNTLFDTPEHTLRRQTAILRIRRYGERWVLTHKCLPGDHDPGERHKHRVETETEVADGEALATIFRSLGYRESFVYEKWRTEYADETGHCVIDQTPIGVFAELEGPESWIDELAGRLGVAREAMLTLSYGRLFEQWREASGSGAENLTFGECGTAGTDAGPDIGADPGSGPG